MREKDVRQAQRRVQQREKNGGENASLLRNGIKRDMKQAADQSPRDEKDENGSLVSDCLQRRSTRNIVISTGDPAVIRIFHPFL